MHLKIKVLKADLRGILIQINLDTSGIDPGEGLSQFLGIGQKKAAGRGGTSRETGPLKFQTDQIKRVEERKRQANTAQFDQQRRRVGYEVELGRLMSANKSLTREQAQKILEKKG